MTEYLKEIEDYKLFMCDPSHADYAKRKREALSEQIECVSRYTLPGEQANIDSQVYDYLMLFLEERYSPSEVSPLLGHR